MAEENYKLYVHFHKFQFECYDGSIVKMAPSVYSWDIESIAQYTRKQFRTDFKSKVFDLDDLEHRHGISVSLQLATHNDDELLFQVGDGRTIHLNVKVLGQSKKRKIQEEDYCEGEEEEDENGTRHKRQKENEDEENERELVHQMERSPEENAAEVCLQDICPVGLVNRKGCCFANAALQCLFATRAFVSYLCGKNCGQECPDFCVTGAMRRLIRKVKKQKPFFANDLLDNISKLGGDFDTGLGRHRDSSEFIMKVLEKMRLETKHGDIKSIFGLTTKTQSTCTKCNISSSGGTETTQLDLLTTCPKTGRDLNTLEECLDVFISKSVLDGDNRYNCGRGSCKLEIGITHDFVLEGPNILIVGLKIYKDGKKVDRHIAFPSELNLAPYMDLGNDEEHMYDLYGAVIHTGSLVVGHYISYIKTHQGWYMMDDEKRERANAKEVLDKNAYVLFYRRRGFEHMGNADAADMASSQFEAPPLASDATSSPSQGPPDLAFSPSQDPPAKDLAFSLSQDPPSSPSPPPSPPPKNAKRLCSTRTLPRNELEESFIMVQDRKPLDVIERIEKAMEFSNPSKQEYRFLLPGKQKVIYDKKLMQYCLPRRDGFRTWSTENPETRVKALRIAFLLNACLQILKLKNTNSDPQDREILDQDSQISDPEDIMSRQREIYYRNKDLFGGEADEDGYKKFFVPAVSEVCMLLGTTRASLGLSVDPRGWIIGPVILYKGQKVHIDCRKKQQIITDDSRTVDFIKKTGKIEFLLIVEKECTFDILRAIKFHNKHNCVVVTGKGYPTIATRAVVRKLIDTLRVPVYGLSDLDRDGLQILCAYKFGSKNCAYDNLYLSAPELVWLGVHPTDFFEAGAKVPHRNLSDRDHQIILNFWKTLPRCRESVKIASMMKAGIRRDIHSKYHRGNIEAYIIEKIRAHRREQAIPFAPTAGRGGAQATPLAPPAGRGGGGGGRDRGRGRGGRGRDRSGSKGRGRGRGRGGRGRDRSGSKGRGRGMAKS